MTKIDASSLGYKELNQQINSCSDGQVCVDSVLGQRFIACGMSGKSIELNGIPGNALGAYLYGADITVHGNAQDATGDTMNNGSITIHGFSGDTLGYAMRGGRIFVRDSVGHRAGIHMKEYKEKLPVIVIGGTAGSFLGEYQAGGIILVLGLGCEGKSPVGYYCSTGMHGGRMYIRSDVKPQNMPEQVTVSEASDEDMEVITGLCAEYCEKFGASMEELLSKKFYAVRHDTNNPYRQLYTYN